MYVYKKILKILYVYKKILKIKTPPFIRRILTRGYFFRHAREEAKNVTIEFDSHQVKAIL